MRKVLALLVIMTLMAPAVFAAKGASEKGIETASDQAAFNRVGDWFATVGKSQEEKEAIKAERAVDRKVKRAEKQARKEAKEAKKSVEEKAEKSQKVAKEKAEKMKKGAGKKSKDMKGKGKGLKKDLGL